MKKILYSLLLVSIIFAACKKEEDEIITPTVLSGCMDEIATNYDATASSDDGSCTYGIIGGSWTTNSEELTMHVVVSNGGMVFMDTTITSPTAAYLLLDPPKTLMHWTLLAPELSATLKFDSVCIIFFPIKYFKLRSNTVC